MNEQPYLNNYDYQYPRLSEQWERPKTNRLTCCLIPWLFVLFLICPMIIFLLVPPNINILFLGVDYAPHKSFIGRSDTIIISSFKLIKPNISLLSIPRDLWVEIPGVGANRINTAHFFAEAQVPGSGPNAVIETIKSNFYVNVDYFIRIRFDGVRDIVDAMGGVDIVLDKPMAGLPIGKYHLTGNKALAFVRNRTNADDFFRMEQGQILIKAILKQVVQPKMLSRMPPIIMAIYQTIDTNIPIWVIPKLLFVVIRVGIDNIDSQLITREMTTPYITDEGASVLLPNWDLILPVVDRIFK